MTTMPRFTAAVGAGLVAASAAMPGAQADTTTGVLDGVTSSVTCTAAGDAVVTLTYPGGLPAGTTAQANMDFFKMQPLSAASELGATTGTVTFSAQTLATAAAYNDVIGAGLATTDGRVAQSAGFAPTLCGAPAASGADRPGVRPTLSVGAASCVDGSPVVEVTTGNPSGQSRSLSLSLDTAPGTSLEGIDAAPGIHTHQVALNGASNVSGPSTLTVVNGSDLQRLGSFAVTLPSCTPTAPSVSFSIAGWECDTLTPRLTYRNESGETQRVLVRLHGSATTVTTLDVPVGVSEHPAAQGLDGLSLDFVDARSMATLTTLDLDSSSDCASPSPGATAPSAPSSTSSSASADPSTTSSSSVSPSTSAATPSSTATSGTATSSSAPTSTSAPTSASGTAPTGESSSDAAATGTAESGGPSSSASEATGPVVQTDAVRDGSLPAALVAASFAGLVMLGASAARLARRR